MRHVCFVGQLDKISLARKSAKEFARQKVCKLTGPSTEGELTGQQLQERRANIQRRKEKLEQALTELTNKKEELMKNFSNLNEDMRQKIGNVTDALDQREVELLNQINRLEQTKQTQQVEIGEDLKVAAAAIS